MRLALLLALLTLVACQSSTPAPQDVEDDTPPDTSSPADVGSDTLEPDTLTPLPDPPWSVDAPGPFNIGYTTLRYEYTPDGETEARNLRLALWYPTRDTSGPRASYFPFIAPPEVLARATPHTATPRPLLLFSHGSASLAEQSYFLTHHFASHGWVVAAPDHLGNTIADANNGPVPPEMFFLRPQDISAALDTLLALPPSDPLAGALSSTVAVAGHSFGGYTTLALAGASADVDALLTTCESPPPELESYCEFTPLLEERRAQIEAGFHDPRIQLALPMAPGATLLFGPGIADIDIPVLLMTGDLDATTPDAVEGDPAWDALDGPDDLRLQFHTGAHFTFSHICDIAPNLAADDGCGPTFIPPTEAFPIINAYALAFARARLLGDTSEAELLSGSRSLHTDVSLVVP